jgi:hypothetical protein
MEDELINYLRDVTRKQTQERRAQAEALNVLRSAEREPQPLLRRRSRALPALPELPGEFAPTKIRVAP